MKDVGEKRNLPPLDLKHLIWILDWAREKCAKEIERMEMEAVQHQAHLSVPACTKWGYKSRDERLSSLGNSLTSHRNIYQWLDGARAQAMEQSNEEFAQDMADYLRQSRRKK